MGEKKNGFGSTNINPSIISVIYLKKIIFIEAGLDVVDTKKLLPAMGNRLMQNLNLADQKA